MKLYKIDLLTLLISLFILASCNNPDEIGLDLDPANSVNTAIDETSTVKAFTVPEEKIVTHSLSQHPLGYLNDPHTGTTVAAIAASLALPNDATTFGTNPVLDSAILVLKYGTNFYGDSVNSTYKFSVHQLSDKLNTSTTYYNDTPIPFNSTELGSLVVSKIKMKDSIKVKQIIDGKPDTELKQAPQIRIPIDPGFINSNFLSAPADKFANSAAFTDFIKGLYLKAQIINGPGGIPFFDMNSGLSKLELYYRNTGASIDTNYVTFAINGNSAPVVAHFTHDYTGTEVETQLSNPNTEYNRNFVQALSGVRTKVTFPDLGKLKQLGNIVINKAILEVKIENGTDIPFAPSPRLILYQTDIASQRQLLPDLDPYDARSVGLSGFGGFYDSATKTYNFVITAYIQDILIGKSKQYATYLAVLDKDASNPQSITSPASNTAAKAVIGSGSAASASKMKLKIIYTKLNN